MSVTFIPGYCKKFITMKFLLSIVLLCISQNVFGEERQEIIDYDDYYMIDRCPDKTSTRSVWKMYCEKKWNEDDDLLMFSPVTSLDTSLTYKNYYCFKCHETTDSYVSWDLLVDSIGSESETKVNSVFYDEEQKTWMAIYDENHIFFPADLSFQFPDNLRAEPFDCVSDMVRDCPDTWAYRRVREKGLAYYPLVYLKHSTYENVHCPLCKYVPLGVRNAYAPAAFSPGHYGAVKNLLYVPDSDKVENAENCKKDHAWDPSAMMCQKLFCPAGKVFKNRRCVPP